MKKILTIAALALTIVACSNDIDEQPAEQPAKTEGTITITAKLAPKSDAGTRAVADNGDNKITVTWAKTEHLAILYTVGSDKKVADAEITDVDATTGEATISFGVDGSTVDGTACQIVYPSSAAKTDGSGVKSNSALLTKQDGTLSANLDVRVGDGIIHTSPASLDVTTQPAAQFAIWKLTFANNTEYLCILADNTPIAGATYKDLCSKEFTVAVPAVSSKTITIVAAYSGYCYYYSKAGVSLTAGKYYQSSPAMTSLGTDNSADVYMISGSSSATIPAGKTVVLYSSPITNGNIVCSGDATIILLGSNYTRSASDKAAIQAGGAGTTLTITGTGKLQVSTNNGSGAGIGNTGENGICGNIIICGGTIEATGGQYAAAIGSTWRGTCGDITITDGVTRVKARRGSLSNNCIGAGNNGHCGTVTIGGVVTGNIISTSQYIYEP